MELNAISIDICVGRSERETDEYCTERGMERERESSNQVIWEKYDQNNSVPMAQYRLDLLRPDERKPVSIPYTLFCSPLFSFLRCLIHLQFDSRSVLFRFIYFIFSSKFLSIKAPLRQNRGFCEYIQRNNANMATISNSKLGLCVQYTVIYTHACIYGCKGI